MTQVLLFDDYPFWTERIIFQPELNGFRDLYNEEGGAAGWHSSPGFAKIPLVNHHVHPANVIQFIYT